MFVVASSTESASFDCPGPVLVEPDFVLVATALMLHPYVVKGCDGSATRNTGCGLVRAVQCPNRSFREMGTECYFLWG